jgi:hypothetical protein
MPPNMLHADINGDGVIDHVAVGSGSECWLAVFDLAVHAVQLFFCFGCYWPPQLVVTPYLKHGCGLRQRLLAGWLWCKLLLPPCVCCADVALL